MSEDMSEYFPIFDPQQPWRIIDIARFTNKGMSQESIDQPAVEPQIAEERRPNRPDDIVVVFRSVQPNGTCDDHTIRVDVPSVLFSCYGPTSNECKAKEL